MKSFIHTISYLFNVRKSVIAKMFVCFISLTLILFFIIMAIWNNNIKSTSEDLTLSHIRDIVQNANTRFESELYMLTTNMRHLAADVTIQDYLEDKPLSETTAAELLQQTYNVLNAKINGIAVISGDKLLTAGAAYFPSDSKNYYWYHNIMDSNDKIFVFKRAADKRNLPHESFSIGIRILGLHGEPIGAMVFNIRKQLIVDCFGALNMKGTMKSVILSDDGEIMFTNSYGMAPETLKVLMKNSDNFSSGFSTQSMDGHDCIVISKKITLYPTLRNIAYAPLDTISNGYKRSLNTAVWCIAISVLILFLFSLIISLSISKQFRALMTYIEGIDINSLQFASSYTPHTATDNDINKIYAKLSQMSREISNQVDEISNLEEKKRVLEIAGLRTQINPHLIYNTLYLIQSQAKDYGIASISNISKSLIQLLNYSVTNLDRFVTLEQELSNVSDYLEIMQNKFHNHTQLRFDIENCVRQCRMPKMIIQPIVENSIKHGFTDNPGQYIQIKAYEKNDAISISIIDNGKGIPADKLKSILDYSQDDSKHLGLKNVDKRIKLTFGDEYGLKILSIPHVYTAVIINIPKIDASDDDQKEIL